MVSNLTRMSVALEEASKAALRGEVPVGAVVCNARGEVIARAGNETRGSSDPTAHAEIIVLRQAASLLGTERLTECTLYVTLEPCTMCAGAISHARIKTLVYGAYDPKGGAVDHGVRFFEQATCLHKPGVISGIEQKLCGDLLREFFAQRR